MHQIDYKVVILLQVEKVHLCRPGSRLVTTNGNLYHRFFMPRQVKWSLQPYMLHYQNAWCSFSSKVPPLSYIVMTIYNTGRSTSKQVAMYGPNWLLAQKSNSTKPALFGLISTPTKNSCKIHKWIPLRWHKTNYKRAV